MDYDNRLRSKLAVRRVNRFHVILIWILSTLVLGQVFLSSGPESGWKILLFTYTASIVASLALLLNLKFDKLTNITAIIIPFSVVIGESCD